MRLSLRLFIHAVLLASGTELARAREVAAPLLDEITVTATRVPTPIDSVAGSVSVISSESAEHQLAQDIKDLVRYEPGVSVRDQGSRFGLAGFTVRGLDGDRVAIEIDGVAIPDAFSIGSFSNASRDFVDIDLLKRTEIIRGPVSSIYGSDALGGVVSFITKDPADYLRETGGDLYASIKGQYAEGDDSYAGTAVLAGAGESLGGSIAYVRREGHETERQGDNDVSGPARTVADPSDYVNDSAIAKLTLGSGPLAGLKLTLDGTRSERQTDVLSAINTITTGLKGDDDAERARAAIEWRRADGLGPFDFLDTWLYWQDSTTRQRTQENRVSVIGGVSTPLLRDRRFEFDQEALGVELVLHQQLDWGTVAHELTWGVDVVRTDTRQMRDGVQTNLLTGASTHVIPPDSFPVRDFPATQTLEAGAYVQDQIQLGPVSLIPGVRIDYLDLDPEPDAIFTEDNPGIATTGLTERSVSPKLGLVWPFAQGYSAFVQYAHGFRAPPYDDVNIGFTNLAFGYTAISNPNLKPETSDGLEIGLRASSDNVRFTLAAYYNRYDDFIESLVNTGIDPATGLIVFQSQNVAEATIYGIEAGARADLAAALPGLALRGSVSYSRGENDTDDVPLDSIDPLRAVLGLGYDSPSDRWGVELVGTATEKKTRTNDLPLGVSGSQPQFEPPASYVFDLLSYLKIGKTTDVRLAVYNLLDREYWDWQDVRGQAASNVALERYTRPGRSVNASILLRW
jgi:hemoglobin/transferrin/lactoferrin receptor protein